MSVSGRGYIAIKLYLERQMQAGFGTRAVVCWSLIHMTFAVGKYFSMWRMRLCQWPVSPLIKFSLDALNLIINKF